MTKEQAVIARDILIGGFENEMNITRRVICAVPQNQCDFRPDKRMRSAFEMAWHIVSREIWFLESILDGQFGPEEARMPPQIRSMGDILDYYDRHAPELVRQVRCLSGDDLARPADFFGAAHKPVVLYCSLLTAHTVHHRGQLALYLRMMGATVPSIYGGSLDEPFQSASA